MLTLDIELDCPTLPTLHTKSRLWETAIADRRSSSRVMAPLLNCGVNVLGIRSLRAMRAPLLAQAVVGSSVSTALKKYVSA